MKKPESICVFGDSTAWGAWDLDKGGWVTRLWSFIGKRNDDYVEVYNLSISGGTTETILSRFENEAKIRNADALIFQTGGNDASYEHSRDNFLVPPEKFKQNIQEIINRAKKITNKILFMDLKNCNESMTMPVSWIDYYYSNENLRKYGDMMHTVCKENEVLFLDIPLLDDSDFDDGLHPNAAGHGKIFVTVKDFLVKENWI